MTRKDEKILQAVKKWHDGLNGKDDDPHKPMELSVCIMEGGAVLAEDELPKYKEMWAMLKDCVSKHPTISKGDMQGIIEDIEELCLKGIGK